MRGPLPIHRPVFPSTCLEEAEQMARQRTVPHQLQQRAILALLLSRQPLVSHTEAAKLVQLRARSIQRGRRGLGPGGVFAGRQAGAGPFRLALYEELLHQNPTPARALFDKPRSLLTMRSVWGDLKEAAQTKHAL